MGTIFKNVFGWIFGKAGIFLVLVITLLCAPFVIQIIEFASDFDPHDIELEVKKSSVIIAPEKTASKEEVERKLIEVRRIQTQKSIDRAALDKEICLLKTCDLIKSGNLYKIDLELSALAQVTAYADAVKNGSNSCSRRDQNQQSLRQLIALNTGLTSTQPWYVPTTASHQKIKDEISQREQNAVQLDTACVAYKRLSSVFEYRQHPTHLAKHTEFLKTVEQLRVAKYYLWVAIKEILPTALIMLFTIVVMPMIIKLISYYLLAPQASRRFGVKLLPKTSGKLSVDRDSERQQTIEVKPGWELLTDPALVAVLPSSVSAKGRLLFDRTSPLTSLACGLYLMTCIRSESKSSVIISASSPKAGKNTPVASHIAVLDLPEGAALVLQPRCVAGVVHQIDRPLVISKHWRIATLSSWLTMQLRYVVFHGPAKLIVRGNGGVNVGTVDDGASINQVATLGFSANLHYGVNRCEPFSAYFNGKKELFDDRFSSGPGFYVQEIEPTPATGGSLNNPFLVPINTALKVFGLG